MIDAPTTRETAEESLDDLLARTVEHVKAMTPEEREAMHDRQKKAWVAAEMAIGDEGTRVVTGHQETADHAELARMAEAASARLAGPNLNADGFGLQIWGDSLKGGSTHVLDVRGWGYLTGGGHGALGLSEDDGISSQRAIQAYAVAAWNAVPALLSEIAALRGERDGLRTAMSKSNDEICQSLGKALGYPWFKDDQANFPGSIATDGVCVGEHVAESIADEAARRLTQAERQRDELRKALERIASAESSWPEEIASQALREYRQALRDFNLMRDDGTLPSAPNQAKEAVE